MFSSSYIVVHFLLSRSQFTLLLHSMMTSLYRATRFLASRNDVAFLRPLQVAGSSQAFVVQQSSSKKFYFTDHRSAYAHLSHGEVLRAWFVLKLCSLDFLVQNSLKVIPYILLKKNLFFNFHCLLIFFSFWSIASAPSVENYSRKFCDQRCMTSLWLEMILVPSKRQPQN